MSFVFLSLSCCLGNRSRRPCCNKNPPQEPLAQWAAARGLAAGGAPTAARRRCRNLSAVTSHVGGCFEFRRCRGAHPAVRGVRVRFVHFGRRMPGESVELEVSGIVWEAGRVASCAVTLRHGVQQLCAPLGSRTCRVRPQQK